MLCRLNWYKVHMIQQQALPATLKSFKNKNIFLTGQSLSSYYLDHWFSSKVVSEFWEIFSFDRDLLPSFLPWFTSNRPAISTTATVHKTKLNQGIMSLSIFLKLQSNQTGFRLKLGWMVFLQFLTWFFQPSILLFAVYVLFSSPQLICSY